MFTHILCRLSVVGCRLSVVGCRLSVVGCRPSFAVGGLWNAEHKTF